MARIKLSTPTFLLPSLALLLRRPFRRRLIQNANKSSNEKTLVAA